MALTSGSERLTWKAPATALSRVTVKSSPPPSAALTSATVTAALSLSVMVPVAVSESSMRALVADSETLKVSSPSNTTSSSVLTVNCRVSPAVPAKLSAATTLSKSSG